MNAWRRRRRARACRPRSALGLAARGRRRARALDGRRCSPARSVARGRRRAAATRLARARARGSSCAGWLVVGERAARRARPQPAARRRSAARAGRRRRDRPRRRGRFEHAGARAGRARFEGAARSRAGAARAAARPRAAAGRDRRRARGRARCRAGPRHGFDERTWLRRQASTSSCASTRGSSSARRGGLGGLADRAPRAARALDRARAHGRAARGPGRDRARRRPGALAPGCATDFRGLGPLPPPRGHRAERRPRRGGALVLAWLLGLPPLGRRAGALAGIAALRARRRAAAVGRPGGHRGLARLARVARGPAARRLVLRCSSARSRCSPGTRTSSSTPGFQLSFAAVARDLRRSAAALAAARGLPAAAVARGARRVSTACGVATAPILWLQFGAVPLLGVPANALAEPAMPLAARPRARHRRRRRRLPAGGGALAWLNGWSPRTSPCAHGASARLPFAQVRAGASPRSRGRPRRAPMLGTRWPRS